MKVRFYGLDETCVNTLKDFFQKHLINYVDGEIFEFITDDYLQVLSSADKVIVIRKGEYFDLTKEYVVIDADMFFHIEII